MNFSKRFLSLFIVCLYAGMYSFADDIGFGYKNGANVFPDTEAEKKLAITGLDGNGQWSIRDFWNHPVAEGIVEAGDKKIVLPLTDPGYYRLSLASGEKIAECGIAVVAPLPQALESSPFGVSTHFAHGWNPALLPVIRAAGFSWFRDECSWAMVERKKGVLKTDYPFAASLGKVAGEVNSLLCFSYGNRFYDDNSAPVSPEALAGWKRYVETLAKNFPQIKTFETWNEYNCGFGMYGKTDPTPENYMLLLKATHESLRRVRPDSVLVGCSATTLPWPWLEGVFKLGGLKYMDAVSVHPYRWAQWQKPPETLYPDMLRLRRLIDKYAEGKKIPIYATEVGWPVDLKYGISESRQAAFVVRTYANLFRSGVEKVFWYSFMKPESDHEQFAIAEQVNGNYLPRPSFAAVATLTRVLAGAKYRGEVKTPKPLVCLKFQRKDTSVLLLWNPEAKPVTVEVGAAESLRLVDIMGGRRELHPHAGKIYLCLAQLPVYLEGNAGKISNTAEFSAIRAVPHTAVNQSFSFTVRTAPGLSLHIDGNDYENGERVSLGGNQRLGTRNSLGDINHNGERCGMFCLSYDVLPQLKFSRVFLRGSSQLQIDMTNIMPTVAQELSAGLANFGEQVLAVPQTGRLTAGPVHPLRLQLEQPVKAYDLNPLRLKLDFSNHPTLQYNGCIGYSPCFYRNNIKIDGNLKEWKSQPYADLRRQGKYVATKGGSDAGIENFAGKIWLGWNKKYLYIAAEILDKKHKQVFPVWKGDSIQFGIGKSFPADTDTSFEAHLAFDAGGKSWLFPGRAPLGFNKSSLRKYAVPKMRRKGNISFYEAAITWKSIKFVNPRNGAFRFSILVNNNDGEKREGWLEWGSGIGRSKDPAQYPLIYLVRGKH